MPRHHSSSKSTLIVVATKSESGIKFILGKGYISNVASMEVIKEEVLPSTDLRRGIAKSFGPFVNEVTRISYSYGTSIEPNRREDIAMAFTVAMMS